MMDTVMDNPALILLNLAKSDKIRSKSANVEPNWDELANNAITKRRTKIRSIESGKWFRCNLCRYELDRTLVVKIYFGTVLPTAGRDY